MANEIKETVPFSFDEIYAGIEELFSAKGYDSPYDGSNISQLITSMAYTTSMLNANTAVNINETILTLAQKRENIIQDARLLGYEPTQKISYIYSLTLKFDETKTYNIPHLAKFIDKTNTYYYMGNDIDIDAIAGDTITIYVKEGNLITYKDEPENLRQIIGNQQFLDIPYPNVEQDGIEVYITYYLDTGILSAKERFFKSSTLLIDVDDNLSKKFVRLENIELGTPRIYFVLSNVGNAVPTGAIVEMNVLQSNGKNGEMHNIPSSDLKNISIIDYSLSVRGNDIESKDSIKTNAPVLHNTASRCVTANDYEVISKKHSACKEAFVFGGEDEHPNRLGNIYLSLTPEKASRTFTQDPENTLWTLDKLNDLYNNYLLPSELLSNQVDSNRIIKNPGVIDTIQVLNLPALKYNIRNPLYVLMNFNINIVKYPLSSVHTQLRQQIFDILNTYIQTLEKFNTEFFKSNIIKKLDEYLTNITGLELNVDFKVMLDKKSLSTETIQTVQKNNVTNEYEIVDIEEKAVHLYLDTPYEAIYDNNNILIEQNLPSIDTENFIDGQTLSVDYNSPTVFPATTNQILSKDVKSITYPINLGSSYGRGGQKIGEYTIYNDRSTYIKVKLFSENLDMSEVKFLTLRYPSENIKTLRSSIFKLNTVSIGKFIQSSSSQI